MDRDALRKELAEMRADRSADEADPLRSLLCAPCLALGALVLAALWYFKQVDLATVKGIAQYFGVFLIWAVIAGLVQRRWKVTMEQSVRHHVHGLLSQGLLERAVDDPESRLLSAPFQLRPLSAKQLRKPITWFVNNYYDFVKAQKVNPFPKWAEWLRWGSFAIVGLIVFAFMVLDMWYVEWALSNAIVPFMFLVMLSNFVISSPIRHGIVMALNDYLDSDQAEQTLVSDSPQLLTT